MPEIVVVRSSGANCDGATRRKRMPTLSAERRRVSTKALKRTHRPQAGDEPSRRIATVIESPGRISSFFDGGFVFHTDELGRVKKKVEAHWSTAVFRVDRPGRLSITFGHEDLKNDTHSSTESQAAFRSQNLAPGRSTIRASKCSARCR